MLLPTAALTPLVLRELRLLAALPLGLWLLSWSLATKRGGKLSETDPEGSTPFPQELLEFQAWPGSSAG